ncbi:antitoxin VapB family protein [Halorubrum halophilum]|uniref:antitoxin VapB family protein n=1 Tax=Halorubrum halophilum TaxID=413816 RepID=UPI000679D496|nr:antitoxin VapB family protein [Halorubrum halophilum]
MSRNISISDDVYRRLKREKGDRSFSDLIADTLDEGGKLADVTGQQVLDPETDSEVDAEIKRLSDGTLKRLTERADDEEPTDR